jgi:alpha-L-fucosidase
MPARIKRSCEVLAVAACLSGTLLVTAGGGRLIPRLGAQAPGPAAAPAAARRAPRGDGRIDWWREARFGLFIHFGLYAVPAGEWNGRTDYGEWIRNNAQIPLDVYDAFRDRFNPAGFDAAAWARQARRAGMRYVVITTKHHDGFALFDSKQTGFTVMSTPFKRDLLREAIEAFRREGLRVGLYYSIMDWHHPDYLPRRPWEKDRPAAGADFERYVAFMKAQLKELLTNYGTIDILWFDGEWEGTWTAARGADLYRYVRSLQPGIIVNNRVGKSSGGGRDDGRVSVGDFGTPEQEVPATGLPGTDWETCMTMNGNWGYNRADKKFKSTSELVRTLVDVASKGGNYLLNVGPDGEGRFPQESVERLQQVGEWLAVNGDSIYGTQASPFPKLAWGRATQRRLAGGVTRLYLHVFDWPADGRLVIDGLLNLPRRAFLLSDSAERSVAVGRDGDALVVSVPASAPSPVDSVVVLDVNGRADVTIPPTISAPNEIFTEALPVAITLDRDNVVIRYTLDSKTPTDLSSAVTGAVVLTSTAAVTAQAFRNGRPVSAAVSRVFRKVTPMPGATVANASPGLNFSCLEGDFKAVPDFDALKPSAQGTADGFDLAKRTRDSNFAMRFRGYIRVPVTGIYTFTLRSDDGSRLWIGDYLVVDNDGVHGSREHSGAVALAAGLQPLTVSMFDQAGGAALEVFYQGPGQARQQVPPSALFR